MKTSHKAFFYGLWIILSIFININQACCEGIVTAIEKPKELTILMREFNQPYVFADGTGIISDIFKESLGTTFKLNFVFLPYERGLLMLQQNQLDVISVAPETAEGIDAYFISQPYIEFQNVAFTLDGGPLKEVKIEDLGHLDVLAFINARIFLGDKFAQQTEKNKKYTEVQDQKGQVRTLLRGRTEVAIMEKNIFAFYRRQLIEDAEITPALKGRGFDIFPSSRYCAIFREKNVMEAFNHGVALLHNSGRYQAIISSYTKDIGNPE